MLFYFFLYLNSLFLIISFIRDKVFFKNPLINYLLKFKNFKNIYTSLTIINISYFYIFLILF